MYLVHYFIAKPPPCNLDFPIAVYPAQTEHKYVEKGDDSNCY